MNAAHFTYRFLKLVSYTGFVRFTEVLLGATTETQSEHLMITYGFGRLGGFVSLIQFWMVLRFQPAPTYLGHLLMQELAHEVNIW